MNKARKTQMWRSGAIMKYFSSDNSQEGTLRREGWFFAVSHYLEHKRVGGFVKPSWFPRITGLRCSSTMSVLRGSITVTSVIRIDSWGQG